jgi:hypothetical protein
MSELAKIYYDPKQGLWSSAKKLSERAKSISSKDIDKFLREQATHQIFKPRNVKAYYPVKSWAPFYKCQLDLLDLSNQANRGYKWLMILIDIHTRFVVCVPLKAKTGPECLRGLQEILDMILALPFDTPQIIQSDFESGFETKQFRDLEKRYGISHQFTKRKQTLGIIERFNKTLRGLIERYKEVYKTTNWIDALPALIDNYNTSYHSTLRTTPIEALQNNPHYDEIIEKQTSKAASKSYNRQEINVGDTVRLLIKKSLFEKGSGPQFTKEVHVVEREDEGNYYVSGRVNPYRKQELQKVGAIQEYEPEEQPEPIPVPSKQEQRVTRRVRKEGISPDKDIVTDENARVLRRFKPRQDLGFFITT